MNFGGRNQENEQFQLAPMIDIVFILLIFFITTYVAAEDERLLNINLPEAQSASDEARTLEETLVNLTDKGVIVLQGRALKPEELEDRLRRLKSFSKNPGVIIRAHAECAHKHIVTIMDICAKVEIRRVFFSTVTAKPVGETDAR